MCTAMARELSFQNNMNGLKVISLAIHRCAILLVLDAPLDVEQEKPMLRKLLLIN